VVVVVVTSRAKRVHLDLDRSGRSVRGSCVRRTPCRPAAMNGPPTPPAENTTLPDPLPPPQPAPALTDAPEQPSEPPTAPPPVTAPPPAAAVASVSIASLDPYKTAFPEIASAVNNKHYADAISLAELADLNVRVTPHSRVAHRVFISHHLSLSMARARAGSWLQPHSSSHTSSSMICAKALSW
jgi:hypothetical protein